MAQTSVSTRTSRFRHAPASGATPDHRTEALLTASLAWREDRLARPDMIDTDEAAALARTSRETINQWIRSGRCIGLDRLKRGWRLPRWQFEPAVFEQVQPIARALGTTEGWALLLFLETPHEALEGRTPRMALEQGDAERVMDLAGVEGTSAR